MNDPEHCKCGEIAIRDFVPTRIHLSGTAVQHAEYNPGLGCVVKDKQHRRELCKARGLEEVGSEPVASLHKYHDERRLEKIDRAYDEADRGWVGNGDTGT